MNRTAAALLHHRACFFSILNDPLRDAMHERVRQTFFDGGHAPLQGLLFFFIASFQRSGNLDHALGCVVATIQDHIFCTLAQLGIEIIVHTDHTGIDDTHRHTSLDRVIQKNRMNGFTRRIIAAE